MSAAGKPDLPIDPDRLRRQFPSLTEEDVAAYVDVTRRILGERDAGRRARRTRETLALARRSREKRGGGQSLTSEESLAVRYLAAVEKMQGRTS